MILNVFSGVHISIAGGSHAGQHDPLPVADGSRHGLDRRQKVTSRESQIGVADAGGVRVHAPGGADERNDGVTSLRWMANMRMSSTMLIVSVTRWQWPPCTDTR